MWYYVQMKDTDYPLRGDPYQIPPRDLPAPQHEIDAAERSAYKAAQQGRRVAKQVIGMVKRGEVVRYAKTGRFFSGVGDIDNKSVKLATNAELKDTAVTVDIETQATEPDGSAIRNFVIIKSIDGQPVERPPRSWVNQ